MIKTLSQIEFIKPSPHLLQSVVKFFEFIQESGSDQYFHPHPFTDAEACRLVHYCGKDIYYLLIEGEDILGYAMLRGWDEGYDVPRLGIFITPIARGYGLGLATMHFLHSIAKRKGCSRIALKVHVRNKIAIDMYKKLGYSFKLRENDYLIGFLDLK